MSLQESVQRYPDVSVQYVVMAARLSAVTPQHPPELDDGCPGNRSADNPCVEE
jgi:hypothetical protein